MCFYPDVWSRRGGSGYSFLCKPAIPGMAGFVVLLVLIHRQLIIYYFM